MSRNKYGSSAFSYLVNNNKFTNNNFISGLASSQAGSITAVRVKSIVLDEFHPRFKDLGEWDALGTIEYEDVINPVNVSPLPTAQPLLGNNKAFPLLEEIVYVLSLPNRQINEITSNTIQYYISTVALWNHPHHNAYPSKANQQPPSQQKTYQQTQLGNISKISSQPVTLNLGNTFVERSNIHPLLPFEGDILYEGRWGNSIRIGSTVKTKTKTPKTEYFNIQSTLNPDGINIPSDIISELDSIVQKINLFKSKTESVKISTFVSIDEGFNNLSISSNLTALLNQSYPLISENLKFSTVTSPQNLINIDITVSGFQSTDNGKALNNWSVTGSSGDPIMILRNGQGSSSPEGWLPVIEDINNNESSIYLASTQKIPLTAANASYTSYPLGSAPSSPDQYAGKQIILNSGRLVFNSTNDHILLTSKKSINLNTSNFNVDSPDGKVVIQTYYEDDKTGSIKLGSIKLGDKDATEPLLYGNKTQKLLQELITSIKTFTNSVFTAKDVATINIAAKVLNGQVTAIEKDTLPNIKSNISYTK